jgi:UDP-N-acetylmuramyl pentapeptide synthase
VVITSVAETHLEGLGTLERVAGEKASILASLAADGLGVVWADSDILSQAIKGYQRRIIRFGTSESADLRLTGYERRGFGQRFQLNGRLWVDLRLPGRHNALNALAAIAVAQRFGFERQEAAMALADFECAEMRLEWIDCGELMLINDAYNANPSSMLSAGQVLSDTPAARRVFIAGDMRELGARTEQLHLRTGRQLAEMGIDLIIGVGLLGVYIAHGAAELGIQTATFDTVDQAMHDGLGLLQAEDVVCIKGSRAMRLERLIKPIQDAFGETCLESSSQKEHSSASGPAGDA